MFKSRLRRLTTGGDAMYVIAAGSSPPLSNEGHYACCCCKDGGTDKEAANVDIDCKPGAAATASGIAGSTRDVSISRRPHTSERGFRKSRQHKVGAVDGLCVVPQCHVGRHTTLGRA